TVMIPLTLYTLSVLVPNVVDGLASVPEPVRQAATAMGFTAVRRVVQVELPIAVPVVVAGVRVAAVSSISLVAVGQLIGQGGLGYYITRGLQLDLRYSTPPPPRTRTRSPSPLRSRPSTTSSRWPISRPWRAR
uniref:ABC transporter permease subunit n=1 Tax=Streptomyces cavernae TaxID=2259034 RepID=UPI001EE4DACA